MSPSVRYSTAPMTKWDDSSSSAGRGEGRGAARSQRPAHARGARAAHVHPASRRGHGQAHGAAPRTGARPRAPPARVQAPGPAEPRAGRTPPARSRTLPDVPATNATHTQSLTLTHVHAHPHATSLSCTLTRVCTAPGVHTHALTRGPGGARAIPAEARLSTSRGMKSLSSELRAQSFMPRRPFMGKLMSLETAETGSRWMLITAGAQRGSAAGSPRAPRAPPARPAAHPGCR